MNKEKELRIIKSTVTPRIKCIPKNSKRESKWQRFYLVICMHSIFGSFIYIQSKNFVISSSNLKICPVLKIKQMNFFFTTAVPKKDQTPAKYQIKKPEYHPIPSFPLPSISSYQVVSVVFLKYWHLFHLHCYWDVKSSLPLNSYNSILADLPVSALVLLYSVSTGSTHDPLNLNLIMPFFHQNHYKLPISPKMKYKLLGHDSPMIQILWFCKHTSFHSFSPSHIPYILIFLTLR